MWMTYLAICLPCRIKMRPIDGRSANKRMVGRKLEMSSRSGSNYLTLAGKSRFWYQIAPGRALRPGFMSILVLQSYSLGSVERPKRTKTPKRTGIYQNAL